MFPKSRPTCYTVFIALTLWKTVFPHDTSTTTSTISPTPTTGAGGGSGSGQCLEHALDEFSTCTDSKWQTYTVLGPSISRSDDELKDKVDKLQNTVDTLLTMIKQTAHPNCSSYQEDQIYQNCQEIFEKGLYEGDDVYLIQPHPSTQPFFAYCELDGDGAWTVIQRRMDAGENFDQDWADFKVGFGPIDGNHWLGNQKIHEITFSGLYTLRINMTDWEGNSAYADYDGFYLEGDSDNYRLRFRSYSGDAGDSLIPHKDMQFSTKDQDHDTWSGNCMTVYGGGGWWAKACIDSNLNGKYNPSSTVSSSWHGIIWYQWKGQSYSLKTTTMKIKPMEI